MAYRPFLIAGFQTAKDIGKEPWLIPQDAFETIENMYVNKGVLEKRLGFSEFARMKHGDTEQSTTAITGIKTYLNKGMPSLLIMDTARCNYYNPVDLSMTDISSDLATPADIFSGSASDFFHFVNFLGVGYMVNNVNQIHQWSGRETAVTPFNIKIDSDPKPNHIDTCRFLFIIDDRLVLLDTVERGDHFPVRLRFAPVLQTDFSASGSGTDDAESQLRISAAGKIGKTVFAYMEGPDGGSFWKIRRTGNTDIPLEWEQVTTTEGSRSPYSGIEFQDGLVAMGLTGVNFYDGFRMTNLGIPKIRDIMAEFNDALIGSVFGHYRNERTARHLLFSLADVDSSVVDRILDYNILENNFTKHKSQQSFFMNCMGGFNEQKVPTMLELDDVHTFDGDIVANITVDSRAILGSPTPRTFIGCRNSRVYKWNDGEFDGTDDDNGKIAILAKSARFNPFTKEGRKVACEKIGFLIDNDSDASFLVSVFKSTSSTAYKTKTISGDGSNDKFWAYVFCDGEIGDFHRIQISHTERGNTPKIHAIMPFFDRAGRLDA